MCLRVCVRVCSSNDNISDPSTTPSDLLACLPSLNLRHSPLLSLYPSLRSTRSLGLEPTTLQPSCDPSDRPLNQSPVSHKLPAPSPSPRLLFSSIMGSVAALDSWELAFKKGERWLTPPVISHHNLPQLLKNWTSIHSNSRSVSLSLGRVEIEGGIALSRPLIARRIRRQVRYSVWDEWQGVYSRPLRSYFSLGWVCVGRVVSVWVVSVWVVSVWVVSI